MYYTRKLASLIRTTGDVKGQYLTALEPEYADSAETSIIVTNKKLLFFSTLNELPNNPLTGTRAFIEENRKLYIFIDGAWKNTQLADDAPIATFDSSSYYADSANPAVATLLVDDSDNKNFIYDWAFIPSNIVDSAIDYTTNKNIITISKKDTAFGIYDFQVIGTASDGIFSSFDTADVNMVLQRIIAFNRDTNVITETGGTVTFTLDIEGYVDGYEFPYTITGVDAGDIDQPLTGTLSVIGNEASISISAINDFTSEGDETLTITAGGLTQEVTISDTSGTPTYSLSGTTNVNEGSSRTLTLTYSNHAGGNVNFTMSNFGDITYSSGATSYSNGSGYWTLSAGSGTATFTFTANADYVTEGVEYTTLTLTGKGVSRQITINDTTLTPSVSSVTSNINSVNEGSSVTFTVTTTNVPNNWRVYWRLLGTATAPDISSPTISNYGSEEGYITVSNNSATLSVTAAADATTEGSQTVIFDVTRLTNTSNTNYATYSSTRQKSVTINDTSVDPVFAAGSGISGASQPSSITTTNNTQITNYTYSAISSAIPATSSNMQIGDWVRIYTDFYNATRVCQVYDVANGYTYVSPGANTYNGWNNRVYKTNANGGQGWTSFSRNTSSMSASERTGRIVFRYSQGSSTGTADRGVFQIADMNITTLGGIANSTGWETSTGHGYGFALYSDVDAWYSLSSATYGRWNYTTGSISAYGQYAQSNGTGVRGIPGSYNGQFYTGVTLQSTTQIGYYWLRSPEFTLSSSYVNASFKAGRRGANMGTLQMYWVPS